MAKFKADDSVLGSERSSLSTLLRSLDRIYKRHGPIRQDVLRKIAFAVSIA